MFSDFSDYSLYFLNTIMKEIEQLAKNNPENKKWQYELSRCYFRLSTIYQLQNKIKPATNAFLSSINILEQLIKKEPDNTEWMIELAGLYESFGNFLQSHHDDSFAELFYPQAVELRKKVQGEQHPEYIICFISLVNLYARNHKANHAETLLKQQINRFEKSTKFPSGYVLLLELLAELYAKRENYNDARVIYIQVASLKKKIFGEAHPEYEAALARLNAYLKMTGTLNSLYGDMSKAMQGNPALTKMDDMLKEADIVSSGRTKKNETVNFAVSYPPCLIKAESYILDVWLFLDEQRNMLLDRIKQENSEEAKIKSEGNVSIERGTTITARLLVDGLIVEPSEKTLIWTGNLNNSSFMVTVPENIKEGPKIGRVCFYMNGLEVSRLHFKLLIALKQKEDLKLTNSFSYALKYKTAFASYASDDRNDVLARVQGLEKAGVDVYMDVRNLRSGERYEDKLLEKILSTDIFYLFWSTAAKKSEWVRKEWEYAFTNRGIDFISPIPLEPPDIVPPPPELGGALHFGDWTLAYKRSKTAN